MHFRGFIWTIRYSKIVVRSFSLSNFVELWWRVSVSKECCRVGECFLFLPVRDSRKFRNRCVQLVTRCRRFSRNKLLKNVIRCESLALSIVSWVRFLFSNFVEAINISYWIFQGFSDHKVGQNASVTSWSAQNHKTKAWKIRNDIVYTWIWVVPLPNPALLSQHHRLKIFVPVARWLWGQVLPWNNLNAVTCEDFVLVNHIFNNLDVPSLDFAIGFCINWRPLTYEYLKCLQYRRI